MHPEPFCLRGMYVEVGSHGCSCLDFCLILIHVFMAQAVKDVCILWFLGKHCRCAIIAFAIHHASTHGNAAQSVAANPTRLRPFSSPIDATSHRKNWTQMLTTQFKTKTCSNHLHTKAKTSMQITGEQIPNRFFLC